MSVEKDDLRCQRYRVYAIYVGKGVPQCRMGEEEQDRVCGINGERDVRHYRRT